MRELMSMARHAADHEDTVAHHLDLGDQQHHAEEEQQEPRPVHG
jgi:hypothetical protein